MERFPGHHRQCLLLGRKSDPDPTSHKVPARITKHENKINNKLLNWEFFGPGFSHERVTVHTLNTHLVSSTPLYLHSCYVPSPQYDPPANNGQDLSTDTLPVQKHVSAQNNHHQIQITRRCDTFKESSFLLTHLKNSHSELYSSAGTMVLPLDT